MQVFYDLTEELFTDTYLSVKYEKQNGQTVFVHYVIPKRRKDKTIRTYGDLYGYFSQKKGFRFAIGYFLEEDESGQYWKAQKQYFYFDRKVLPKMSFKELKNALLLAKKDTYKPRITNH